MTSVAEQPTVQRTARCSCGRTTPSDPSLALFEDRSARDLSRCTGCRFTKAANDVWDGVDTTSVNTGRWPAHVPRHGFTPPAEGEAASGAPAYATVVAEAPAEISKLSVGEAVMRMDLADQQVLMFRNSTTGDLNVVYRRGDGHIGWIDPTASR